jgi:hypothetical protein|tara:strand:- start:690 stop:872 length:183 start_codon:yes stop_codon:yes gene_type:complete
MTEEDNPNWFMISQEWLIEWKQWLTNRDKNNLKNTLPPGPICNDFLFAGDPKQGQILPDL